VPGPSSDSTDPPQALVRAAVVGFLAFPLAVAAVFVVLPEQATSPWWQRFSPLLWVTFVGVFGLVGVELAAAWALECRITVVTTVLALAGVVAWLPLAFGEPPNIVFALGGTVLVVVPLLTISSALEYGLRADAYNPLGRLEVVSLLAGIAHLFVVDGLTRVLERRSLLPGVADLSRIEPIGVVVLAVVSTGLIFALAVPIVLAGRYRLGSPLAVVVVGFVCVSYWTWQLSLETLPPAGPGFGISPTPLTAYTWGSTVLVVVVLGCGGLEMFVRRLRSTG